MNTSKIPLDLFNRCLQVASARAKAFSPQDHGAFHEGILLHKAMSRLLLAKTRPVGFPFVTWKNLISYRAERFLAGDWQPLWNEAAAALVGLAQRKERATSSKKPLPK